MRPSVLAVIPARLGSERLARKPLHPIAGKPLIEWVWRRASGFRSVDVVVVATDSEEVATVCRAAGAEVELTSPDHMSGTDRVAEVAARPAYREHGIIVNIQGDEPLLAEDHVAAAVDRVVQGWDVGTVAAPVGGRAALADPSVVKVVVRRDGGALYFSRAPIPHARDGLAGDAALTDGRYLRHVGLYAFERSALERWVTLPADELEALEKLEQLRALRAGLTIGVAVVAGAEGGVDTEADARRVEAILEEGER